MEDKKDWKETVDSIQSLWELKSNPQQFLKKWIRVSPQAKRGFVQKLDGDSSQEALASKASLVTSIYKSNKTKRTSQPTWPNINSVPTYYHASTMDNIKNILQEGEVKVMGKRLYKGAYVSTQPEKAFGNVVLAFNRNIEFLSSLSQGKPVLPRYWAGFSEAIPVNKTTLNKIFIFDGKEEQVAQLQEFCDALCWNSNKAIKVEKMPKKLPVNDLIPRDWNRAISY